MNLLKQKDPGLAIEEIEMKPEALLSKAKVNSLK